MRSPREFHPEMDAYDLEHRHERNPLVSVALVVAFTLAFGGMLRAAVGWLETHGGRSGALVDPLRVPPVPSRSPESHPPGR
jgi:hypothetical protein